MSESWFFESSDAVRHVAKKHDGVIYLHEQIELQRETQVPVGGVIGDG